MKYRYIEFTDNATRGNKAGNITFVGTPSQELIDELELNKVIREKASYSLPEYVTTLNDLGEKGWELQFVTQCGFRHPGPIEQSFIFRKEVV